MECHHPSKVCYKVSRESHKAWIQSFLSSAIDLEYTETVRETPRSLRSNSEVSKQITYCIAVIELPVIIISSTHNNKITTVLPIVFMNREEYEYVDLNPIVGRNAVNPFIPCTRGLFQAIKRLVKLTNKMCEFLESSNP